MRALTTGNYMPAGRFNDDYSPPGSFGARGSVEDRARPLPGAA